MKKISACLVLFIVLVASGNGYLKGQDKIDTEQKLEFESLFNGKDLSGWYAIETYNPREFAAKSVEERKTTIEKARAETPKFWRVENGEIVNDGEGPYLTSDREFRDFELRIEYQTVAKADSGVYLKATPQVQIWDYTEAGGKWDIGADKGSGGLWNNSPGAPGKDPLVLADKPFGEWNNLRIRQIGARTSVWLNDKLVVDQCDHGKLLGARVTAGCHRPNSIADPRW